MNQVLCIAGPTASGKSSWAIDIAKDVDGEIINADSMQVYQELHIISARPTRDEMKDIPHHLYGHVSGRTRYSTGMWLDDSVAAALDCLARGKIPIFVGGTGLYFKALVQGLAQIPQPSENGAARAQTILDQGIDALRAEAERLDPVAAVRVLGNDPQRLMRIVSVALGTDKPISEWQKETYPVIPTGYWQGVVLLPERQSLYDRINDRYEAMLNDGGLDEAKFVLSLDIDPNLPMMKAIGLPPLLQFLKGKISYDEAIFQAQRDTRRFAKRQFTWFRGQASHWISVNNSSDKAIFRHNFSPYSD